MNTLRSCAWLSPDPRNANKDAANYNWKCFATHVFALDRLAAKEKLFGEQTLRRFFTVWWPSWTKPGIIKCVDKIFWCEKSKQHMNIRDWKHWCIKKAYEIIFKRIYWPVTARCQHFVSYNCVFPRGYTIVSGFINLAVWCLLYIP